MLILRMEVINEVTVKEQCDIMRYAGMIEGVWYALGLDSMMNENSIGKIREVLLDISQHLVYIANKDNIINLSDYIISEKGDD